MAVWAPHDWEMDRLDRHTVHEICTNQVVVTLQACVKELVENALDAGATRIEVRIRENGSELLEVVDNGKGISPEDYGKVAQRHATSKIRDYDDLSKTLQTFGFRGEALSAIAAMGEMTACTRTAADVTASLLAYDRFGVLSSQTAAAREVGTTVSVRDLFMRLPVRHKEFIRNAKSQVVATLKLIQSYAIAQPEIRFTVNAEKAKGQGAGRATLLCTSGLSNGWRHAAAAVFGDSVIADVEVLELKCSTGWTVSGLISLPHGGRRSRDTQLFYVNRRPIDPPKRIAKLINDTYHQYNSRMWPVVILSFSASQGLVDVNVTPDKRTVFLHNEEALLCDLQQGLTELYASAGGRSTSLLDFGISSQATRTLPSRAHRDSLAESSNSQMNTIDSLVSPGTSLTPASKEALTPTVTASRQVGAPDGLDTPEKQTLASEPSFQSVPMSQSPSGRAWSRPLQRRSSEAVSELSEPEFHIVEIQDFSSAPSQASSTAIGASIATDSGDGVELDGFKLTEEYAPASMEVEALPLAPLAPLVPLVPLADAAEADAADAVVPPAASPAAAAVGCSVRLSLSLAEIGAGIERRKRQRNQASDDHEMASVEFPSAFSLAALQSGSSLEEVAKFATASSSKKSRGTVDESSQLRFDKSCFSKMRVIGQFNLGFIIASLRTSSSKAEVDDGLQLFIIDQHASDEKFRFEGLNRDSKIDRQPLVSQHMLQLTPAQEQLAEAHLEVFRLNGFDLRKDEARPPGRRLGVASLPTCQGLVFGEKDIHDLLFKLEEAETEQSRPSTQDASQGLLDMAGHRGLWSSTAVPRPPKVWQLLACRACRGAIMIGKALRVSEMEKILSNLGTLQQPWNCPHGRPTMRHLVDARGARQAPKATPPLRGLREGGF